MEIDLKSGQYEEPARRSPAHVERPRRSLRRRAARALGIGIALLAGLAVIGASYEALSASGDGRTYPPPGRLVDVGGYRLHIQCLGTGSPTVVLDAGLGGTSLDWNLVQAELAHTTRVCAYDRAGMGWSDEGPQPRTPDRIARELDALLTGAGIAGPYVLVGHSLAGKNARLFALQHPEQVAGMVLVDARSEYVDDNTPPADAQTFQNLMGGLAIVKGVARRLGLARLVGANLAGTPAMTTAIRHQMALFDTGQRGLAATTAEARERATDDARLLAAPSLGDRPLIVLASGQNMSAEPTWPEAQRRLAALSSTGQLMVAEGSSHYIHWDQPALVIDAVRQVVAQLRRE